MFRSHATGSLVGAAPCGGALMGYPAQAAKHKVFPMVSKVSQGHRPEGGGAARAALGARRGGPGRRRSRRSDKPVYPTASFLQAFSMLFGWFCRGSPALRPPSGHAFSSVFLPGSACGSPPRSGRERLLHWSVARAATGLIRVIWIFTRICD